MYSKACQFCRESVLLALKTFKAVLNLCKEGRLADEALLLLRKMLEFDLGTETNEIGLIDFYLDMVKYVSMIKGFCDVGRLEEACSLFKVRRGHGCVPNVLAYSTLLDGICWFGNGRGWGCNPNVLTYTSLMQDLCKKCRTMDAFAVLDRMEALVCSPNRVTLCGTLLKALCMEGHLEEAYKLIDGVVVGGSVSYSDCYSSLVVCLITIKNIESFSFFFPLILIVVADTIVSFME
ncbi:hypothetical protein P3X46_016494 [Hevea brasiliensis]|uniref:Pentacotripeptide-repeat region of PRORP domain-containing protein n=1 Tax=Hevea brasiliensis TaxID=3981 RepID=A0ABQ9LZB9_HEVBR|nr:hypothetical protein P3X46_016494 [Hevea brasiliensis]